MCLSVVEKSYFWPRNVGVSIGYKVFYQLSHEKVANVAFIKNTYELDKWYKCNLKSRLIPTYDDSYPGKKYYPGFHILKTEQDANNFYAFTGMVYNPYIYQVEYKGLMGYGIQDGYSVDIAKYMKIIKYIGPAQYERGSF